MALYFIKDTTLTDIAQAIRDKTGSEDKIAVTDFATKIGEIETGGASVSVKTETLLEETTLSFSLDSDLGRYIHTMDASFVLEVDKTYIVTIDGKEYVRTAEEATVDSVAVAYVGNKHLANAGSNTSGDFGIWYNATDNTINIVSATEDSSRMVSIRKIVENDSSGGGTASLVVKAGSFKSTGENVVTHGMGTVPLLIAVYAGAHYSSYSNLGNGKLLNTVAVNPIFLDSVNDEMFRGVWSNASFTTPKYDFTKDADSSTTEGSRGQIRAVNTQSFKIGASDGLTTVTGWTYYWIAIGYASE